MDEHEPWMHRMPFTQSGTDTTQASMMRAGYCWEISFSVFFSCRFHCLQSCWRKCFAYADWLLGFYHLARSVLSSLFTSLSRARWPQVGRLVWRVQLDLLALHSSLLEEAVRIGMLTSADWKWVFSSFQLRYFLQKEKEQLQVTFVRHFEFEEFTHMKIIRPGPYRRRFYLRFMSRHFCYWHSLTSGRAQHRYCCHRWTFHSYKSRK